MKTIGKTFLIGLVLAFAFIATTIITDAICEYNGYYDEGRAEAGE